MEDNFLISFLIKTYGYLFQIIIIFIIVTSIIRKIFQSITRKLNRNYFKNNIVVNKREVNKKTIYLDVSKEELIKFNVEDINVLKDFFYNIFLEFEKSYNNLDYNMLKILSTKQLFNNYYTGISLDLKVGRKKIITDIEKKKVKIFALDSTIAKQVAEVMIEISYISYTIDKNGYVISGSRNKKITEKFEVIFRKDFEREEVTKCQNCGAEIIGNKCEYCRSTLKNVEFKISSIKKIIDEQ